MKVKKEKLPNYSGDLVWARLKYCPYWPARLVTAPPSIRQKPRNKICVLFFGSKQFGFVDPDKVVDYFINRTKLISKGKGFDFSEAVKRVEEYVSDPVKYKANAIVKPSKVIIKTERNVEEQLEIKQEPRHSQSVNLITSSNSSECVNTWVHEKQTLIDKISSLKSENQQILFELKKSQDALTTSNTVRKELETKAKQSDEKHMTELSHLRSEISSSNAASEAMKIEYEKRVSDLTRDRDLSQARYKQLKNSITQQKTADEESSQNNFNGELYEVECLLDDKMIRKTRQYLVRWKGYDTSHDSWVKESDLKCPSILKKYKGSK